MEKNNLLNLLLAGGIAVAIALGGAGLGVALNKGKSFQPKKKSIDDSGNVKTGFLGLYGGYKSLVGKALKAAKQEILGIDVSDTRPVKQGGTVDTVADGKEVEVLDLSKTIGSVDWIKKQLKHPNLYTSAVDKKTLYESGFDQTITFTVEFDGVKFDTKKFGIFGVHVTIVHTTFVAAVGGDFEVAIILNKKTGKVFYFTTVVDKFKGIAIIRIFKIAAKLI